MIKCNFDGACEPKNPGGNMGIGAYIEKDNKILFSHSSMIQAKKENTNNVAEYLALKEILIFLLDKKLFNEEIEIHGDSKLVIEQMWGTWKMRKGEYIPIALQCQYMLKKFSKISGSWVPREQNQMADDLSKAALLKNNVKITQR
jgi:ribonuclease HI